MIENELINRVKKIVVEAGKMLLSTSGSDIQFSEKSSNKDLVTQYDNAIQYFLIDRISIIIEESQFYSEENESVYDLYADDLFIIDPIDGTTNFVHKYGLSAISVAWYKKGSPYYGIVYNPFTDEMFEAVKDRGSFLNSNRITVSKLPLKESIVSFGTSPYDIDTTDYTFDLIKQIYYKCQDIRRFGSAALDICYVACGRSGLYFEAALSLWDYAAAALILSEAGGMILDFKGDSISLKSEKTSVIAGRIDLINESGIIKKN